MTSPANVSFIEEEERKAIVRWYRNAARELPFSLAAK